MPLACKYEVMIEAQNKEIDILFAMNAHISSTNMERASDRMEIVTERMYLIAKATERDTLSMHIITLFTLVLLLGTFLGTFFSTPIIGDSEEDNSWSFNPRLFGVFMAVTIGVWFCYMKWTAGRRTEVENPA
ncbi:hypothetical protein SCARD494_01704 [Seiridium cardinale]